MLNTEKPVFTVDIADIGRSLFSGKCRKLVVPSAGGEICILARHAPLLTQLRPGEVRLLTAEDEEGLYYISGGYLEFKDDCATILADQMLRSDEIDRQAADEAREQAESLLREKHTHSEKDAVRLDLMKALAQLRVLEHSEIHRLKTPKF